MHSLNNNNNENNNIFFLKERRYPSAIQVCVRTQVLAVVSVERKEGRKRALTPSLLCPVFASISCRARTDSDCSSTKLQMHRSGGTYCRAEGGKEE